MVEKLVKCPICEEIIPVEISPDVVKNAKRFPVTSKIEHNDHYFYVNQDSKGSLTDVLHPDLVE